MARMVAAKAPAPKSVEVVAIDRRDDDVGEVEGLDGAGEVLRLARSRARSARRA